MIKYLDDFMSFGFPEHEFALFGSAPLVIRGLREINKDLDVIVTERLWDYIVENHHPPIGCSLSGNSVLELASNIEIFKTWPPFESPESLISSADVINGIRYVTLENLIIWKSSLARDKDLIDIKAVESYLTCKKYLGKRVRVHIDRPLGSTHPKYDWIYPVNYGFLPDTISGDGEGIDAYVLGISEPLSDFEGMCIAAIHRQDDNDPKLIITSLGYNLTDEQILTAVSFQEQYFRSRLIRQT